MVNFHLNKRPQSKQSTNNVNCNNHINNGNKTKENLGAVGNISTLAWLYCDLQPYGRVIVRQGWREGLPLDKPPIWTFCPLLKGNFPRDRILVTNCKTCPHFKGMSQNPNVIQQSDITSNYKINFVPARKHKPKIGFTKEQFKEAVKLHRKENRKWKKEERGIFGKNS